MPATPRDDRPAFPHERVNLLLGLVAIGALFLGVWQIRTLIKLPFAVNSSSNTSEQNINSVIIEGSNVEALKNKDTDGDGLSDYDEIYIYKTSPYLKDTDSDGYDDKTEVTTGNDPLCPKGQNCGPQVNKLSGETPITPNQPTAEQIRQFLKTNGATDEILSKYDDAALLKLYKEVANSDSLSITTNQPSNESNSSATPNTTPSQLTQEQKDAVLKLSGAELRQLLINSGADATMLEKFDDDTVKSIVRQTLGL
jgi:hypothetical protein